MTSLSAQYYEDEDEDDVDGEQNIQWSNLLFLPFNPTFKAIVLVVVILKTILVSKHSDSLKVWPQTDGP